MNKKLLSILISIVMVGTMIAVPAFATEAAEETEKQAKEVLAMFQKIINGERITASGMQEFTNGHYKRGVE